MPIKPSSQFVKLSAFINTILSPVLPARKNLVVSQSAENSEMSVIGTDCELTFTGSSEVADDSEAEIVVDRQIQHRTNTLMHVCWHRNTSVSMAERSVAVRVSR
jgi:hypothetical protein